MRRYRVTFEAELSDRDVDMIADLLWDNGAGTITFRPVDDCCWIGDTSCPEHGWAYEHDYEEPPPEHYSRADSTRDRDALRDALQHDTQRGLKW